MFENIDDLIELNLKLLAESITQSVFKHSFLDENGNNLKKSEIFAKILEDKRLITFEPKQRFRCDLTEFGRDIIINGGWFKYLDSEKLKLEKAESKEVLEVENLKLQKESIEYSKTLRKKEDEIIKLTSENLILQNRQLRMYVLYSVLSFISGAVLTNLKDILNLWKILTQ